MILDATASFLICVAQDEMSVEPVPKVYLQNRLSKCKEKLQEVQTIIASKRRWSFMLKIVWL